MRKYDRGRSDVLQDLRIEHKGLETLAALNVTELIRALGEQETIELISKLISHTAISNAAYVDGLLQNRGLI